MKGEKMIQGLVSIAIPAYKRKWLNSAIESVLNQDYSNIELIIVDDHSPQNLKEVVEPYLVDKRISYYHNETNLGKESITLNWNKCIEYARGEFFVLLCDDDIMCPTFISEMLSLSIKYGECNVFHSRVRLVDANNGMHLNDTPQWPEYESFLQFLDNTLKGYRHHTVSEFLYRTKIIRDKGGYVVLPAGYYSDIASVLRFSEEGGICSSDKCLMTFQKSDENISSRIDYNLAKAKAALLYYDWLISNYPINDMEVKIEQRRDYDLCEYYMRASLEDSIRILLMVPNSIWNLKKKIALGVKKNQTNRTSLFCKQ